MSHVFSARILALVLVLPFWATAAEIVSEKESRPFPGIRIVEWTTDAPHRIFAAFISLNEPSLKIDATAPPPRPRSVEEWAESTGALVATNGDFSAWADGVPYVYGQAVGGGELWPEKHTGTHEKHADQWFYQNYGWIGFGPDGPQFSHSGYVKKNSRRFQAMHGWKPDEVTHEIPDDLHALVSGFSQLVVEGEPIYCEDSKDRAACFPDRGDMHARHPRTAMGLTEDMKTFILVVVDGRSDESIGMFGAELAELMDDLGAWVAINIDGGGSSQMYVKGRGVVNDPSSQPHRKILNHWGVLPANE